MIFGYLLSTILLADVTIIGLLITYFFNLELLLEERIASGALIGIVVLGCFMLPISFFLGLNFLGLATFLIVINLVGFRLFTKITIKKIEIEVRDLKNRFQRLSWKLFLLFVGLFILIFCYLAFQLLTFNNGRYYVQPGHAYGDISLHLSFISSFAYGNNFPPQSPILSGTKISYPFLVDFITAIFINPLSLKLDQAVAMVGMVVMGVLIILLAYFSLKIIGNKLAAGLVLILFFLNGGLGFLYFLNDLQNSNFDLFQLIRALPRDYTALKDLGFTWINVIISMLLPQRSFLLGLPITILVLRIFWGITERFDLKKLIFVILLTSCLPIIHVHSLIVLSPILFWLTIVVLLKNTNRLTPIFILGFFGITIIFILSKLFLQQSDNFFSLMQFKPGWMSPKGEIPLFYIKNFGINLIIIPLVIFFGIKEKLKIAYLALIGQIWFILPSLFIFQPWDFDNTKLFIYWYLFSTIILAHFFNKLILTHRLFNIILVGIIMTLLTFSGFLDIIRLIYSSGTRYEIYSPQAINLAEFVKNNSTPKAVFLSIDKFDNPVLALAGRKVVVGYSAWLWSYGLDYSQREIDVKNMLMGQGSEDLFKKYNISHVILFRGQNNYIVSNNYFSQFRLIYDQDGYRIFKI